MVSLVRKNALELPCELPPELAIGDNELGIYVFDTSSFEWVVPRLEKLTGVRMENLKETSAGTLCRTAQPDADL